MNKNPLFIALLLICVTCLFIGIFNISPTQNKIVTKKSKTKIDKLITPIANKVAVIKLEGMISSSSTTNFFEEDSPSVTALQAITKAEKDENVKGIVLCINSPGGTVGMSQRLYNAIYSARQKKPVIAVMDDIAASGGYYVASAADRIVALPGTMTGSIGVIMSTMDFHKLLSEKLSIGENVIKSGKYKDIGSSTRIMTTDEKKLLQDMVNDSYNQFKEAIIKGRVERNDEYNVEKTILTLEKINKYADGRVFTGRQARDYGFVDSIGGIQSANEMMKKMVYKKFNIPENTSLDYDYNYSKSPNILKLFSAGTNENSINNFLPASMKYAGKPLYLWE
ncbi:signal peptide peptidase SppA [bacterium]|nr:signal peptide peptidase SppA [bacterium]